MWVFSSGVDTLHLSARGSIRPEVWETLEVARQEAKATDEPIPVELGDTGQAFLVKAHTGYAATRWLSSPVRAAARSQ